MRVIFCDSPQELIAIPQLVFHLRGHPGKGPPADCRSNRGGVICVAFACTMSVTISMAAYVVILLFRQLLVINATCSPRVQEKPLVTVSNMPFELIDEPNIRQENRV